MEKLLSELKPQDSGTVKRVTGAGAIRRRLFDMGVTPSANVVMRKAAPLGDPIEVAQDGSGMRDSGSVNKFGIILRLSPQ